MKFMSKQKRMKTTKYFASICLVFLALQSFSAFAQSGEVVDKIVAKVDDKIILKSELEGAYINFLRSQEARDYQGDARCLILRNFVENKVMLVMSEIDSVQLDPSRVDYEVQGRLQRIVQQYGSEEAIEQAYGKSMEQFADELRPTIEEQLLIQQQEDNVLAETSVTPNEVRKFFNQIPKDSLPLYSVEYEVGMIVKEPEVSRAEKDKLREELIAIRERALKGESFEILATSYSQGPTASNGGNLGFHPRGAMDPAYEAGALSLKPGEISMPIESSFGIHLIQLIEKRGNEYNSRHIIMMPKPSEQDVERAANFLDSLKTQIEADSITFEAAAKEYSDDKQTSTNGGFLQGQFGSLKVPAEGLDPELFFAIDKMKEGEISEPQKVQVSADQQVVRIIYYKKRIPPHKANLSDDFEKLKAATLQMKKAITRQEYLSDKMKEVYLEVDPEYNRCGIVNEQ